MKKGFWFLLFLGINFGGLALGSLLMNNGPTSDWYTSLNQAPWTPPGWVFGAAWTLIMIFFSWFLAQLFGTANSQKVKLLFCLQVVLNVSWNYVFFNQQLTSLGLLVISALTVLISYFFVSFKNETGAVRYALLPYMIWLILATSLNAYIVVFN